MYGFFGLLSGLRGIFVDYAKAGDGGQWVMEISTMFVYGRVSQPESIGLEIYRTEFYCLKIQISNIGQLFNT